jgi:hypothetical protein
VRKKINYLIWFFIIIILNNLSYSFAFEPVKKQKVDNEKKQQTMVIDVQQGLKGLAISRNDVQSGKNKEGDAFSAKIVEDIKSDNTVVISSGAVLKGFITKIESPQNLPCRDGVAYISMSEIELPDGKIINISESKIKTIIYSPYRVGFKNKIMNNVPALACYYGALIPLSLAQGVAGPIASCIATGGAVLVGATSGYIFPDKARSRTMSAMNRSIDATPVGIAKDLFAKGESADIKSGDGLIVTFDTKTIQKILEKRNIQIKVVEANKPWF